MFLSGIADEASPLLERQIAAHKELGWKHIELRNIEGTNLTDLSEEEFERVAGEIQAAGLQVSCFASQIANWSRPIDSDYDLDLEEMGRAVPRMVRLGTKYIRCMSYPNAETAWPDNEWRHEVVRRLRGLAKMAEQGDVIMVHENCNGWGGQGPRHSLQLVEEVASAHFRLVFDTGNPIPYDQDSWSFYEQVREHIVYVHVKDYEIGRDGKEMAVFPGEGRGAVREVVADLLSRGYDGGLSIEPHITSVIHLGKEAEDPDLAYRTYVKYGRSLEKLIKSLR
jgi:sugar phosphate isomerase/epimerase